MIENILPQDVASVGIRGDDHSAFLFPQEAAQIDGAIEKRVQEFTIGRTCGRRALHKLGLPPTPILRGPRREPLWPSGVVGSITHCDGFCAAAVARQQDVLAVAIDAETHDALPSGVLERVSREEERSWLDKAPSGIYWDRLLFSAKESVYKAWFPLTGLWLNFEEVLVSFDPRAETFNARLLVSPPMVSGHDLFGFTGRFLVRDGLAITTITLQNRT